MVIPPGVSRQPVPNQRARWAFLEGTSVGENPYPLDSPEGLRWMENWFQEQSDFCESVEALCNERGRLGK
jgi:hypothetical protein